ncbi:MAG TPA: DUF3108 domain-containing protein [Rhodocyclaceae bacterium]|nr:DUF3108 domain-containing protein [Rhodocyclaceae bacterium]
MSPRRRTAFLLALAASLALHFLVLAGPGWHLGALGGEGVTLEARLEKAAPPVVKSISKRKPVFKPASDPAPQPAVPASDPAPVAQADGSSAPPSSPAPVAVAEEAPEVAPPLPRRGRIRFSVFAGKFLAGQSVHQWRHDGKRYKLSAVTETVGLAALFNSVKVSQVSEGSFRQGELKPDSYRGDKGDGEVQSASFDWSAGQVTLGNGQAAPITEGAEDVLSMLYQLMQAAQRGEGFAMPVATGRKVERYAFEWLGEDALDIKAGSFHAWHVRVVAVSDQDKTAADTMDIWLGREVDGLPIRIRQTDRKGGVTDLVADEIDYEGKKS